MASIIRILSAGFLLSLLLPPATTQATALTRAGAGIVQGGIAPFFSPVDAIGDRRAETGQAELDESFSFLEQTGAGLKEAGSLAARDIRANPENLIGFGDHLVEQSQTGLRSTFVEGRSSSLANFGGTLTALLPAPKVLGKGRASRSSLKPKVVSEASDSPSTVAHSENLTFGADSAGAARVRGSVVERESPSSAATRQRVLANIEQSRRARGASRSNVTTGGMQGRTFFRSMSQAEAEAVKGTGVLRGGRPGETFFTDQRIKSGARAQDRLSLPNRPEVQMEFRIRNSPALNRKGTRVKPDLGGRGGGREFSTFDQAEVEIINVQPF